MSAHGTVGNSGHVPIPIVRDVLDEVLVVLRGMGGDGRFVLVLDVHHRHEQRHLHHSLLLPTGQFELIGKKHDLYGVNPLRHPAGHMVSARISEGLRHVTAQESETDQLFSSALGSLRADEIQLQELAQEVDHGLPSGVLLGLQEGGVQGLGLALVDEWPCCLQPLEEGDVRARRRTMTSRWLPPQPFAMATHDVNLTSPDLVQPAGRRRVAACLCGSLGITGDRWLLPKQNRPCKLSVKLSLHGQFLCYQ